MDKLGIGGRLLDCYMTEKLTGSLCNPCLYLDQHEHALILYIR